jgi:hypothetical protein
MTEAQSQPDVEPTPWSLNWLLKKASWILLGQFRIPGWLGLLFAIFWGVPTWQSKIDFWVNVAKSSGGLLGALADILTWPYLSATIAIVSFVYLGVVSLQARPDSPRNAILGSFAWISLTLVVLTSIIVAGYGAAEFYIRSEIEKGRAAIPRSSSPADSQKNGTDRPMYGSPRALTQNQQRLLSEMAESLQNQLPKPLQITYLATDMEAFGYAQQFRTAFEHAAVQTSGPIEQPLGKPGLSGVIIEVDDVKSPTGRALQQALELMDAHPQLISGLPRYGNYPVILFIGPRPVQP